MKKHFFNYLQKLHLPKRIMMLLPVLFLMPVISQAGNWPGGHLNTNATYHVYSAGTGYQFRINDNPTVFDGLGWLSVSNGATVNFIFHTTKPIGVTGGIKVDQGTLNMSLANDYNVPAGQPTLVRWTQQSMFHLCNATANVENAKLNITGLPNKQFIIDGAANITYSGSNEAGWTMTNSGTVAKNPLVLLQGGKANLNYVDLRNNWYYLDGGTDGSAINIQSQSFTDYSFDPAYVWYCSSETILVMNNTNISKCAARRWGAAVFASGPKVNGNVSSIEMTDCKVTECCILKDGSTTSGCGAMIRPHALSHCTLKMTRCSVLNNKSLWVSGGVHWEAGMVAPMEMTDCVIESNYSVTGGGGVYLQAPAILKGCKIRNNYTLGTGGGVCFSTFGGPATNFLPTTYTPADATITLDENTEIIGNHADNGGGLSINVNAMNLAFGYGTEPAPTAWCVFQNNQGWQYKINVEVNGAKLLNNSANGYGGGIYMQRSTDIYQTNVRLNWGKVENNTAGRTGGACLIQSYIDENFYYGTCPYTSYPDSLNMWVEIGSTSTDSLVFVNNSAASGGGMYVNASHNPLHTTSKLFVNINQNGFVGLEGKPNIANGGHGGGVYVSGGDVKVKGGNVTYNQANKSGNNGGNGGGFYVTGGRVSVEGGIIERNAAAADGGGFFVSVPNTSDTTFIKGGAQVTYNTAQNGGGAYVSKGILMIDGAATSIAYDTAYVSGGGIYMANGTVYDTLATLNGNISLASNGGAFYIGNGSIRIANAGITNNSAPNGNGGGVYVGEGHGAVTLKDGATVSGNSAINGGGLCVNGGSIEYDDGTITGNTATGNGGGIYANSDVTFVGGTVSNNTAVNGGGLYSASGTVDFSSGTFSQNTATGNGGGMYVASGATVKLSGNAVITKNHVPYASGENVGHGGGVYLAGYLKVGRNAGDGTGVHSLKVQDNYQDTEANLNNVYLPSNDNVIELISDVRGSNTKLGFSVDNGFRKVVYHANDAVTEADSWLHGLLTEGGSQGMTGVIFDDSRKYMAVHVLDATDQTFNHNYIYLWGCWTSAVDKDPNTHTDDYPLPTGTTSHYTIDGNGTWHIYTKEGLAWFSSYVNGLNAYSSDYNENVNAAAKAVMEADVDMNEYLWVPLGSAASFSPASDPTSSIFTDGHKYSGQFDGQGHTIRGLDCRYINSIHHYGLFGEVVGAARISNTFVDGCYYSCSSETGEYVMGGIAGSAGGTTVIANCEARGTMASPESEVAVLGGLVGILDGSAQVHSSIGIPALSGKALYMGGLAGQTAAGTSVKNSFANASFSNPGMVTIPGTLGGLVGYNAGTTENCYARLHGDEPDNDTHFGWLVGENATGGQVNYCYSPATGRYFAEDKNDGTLTGCGHYEDDTQVPYLYARRDNQVETAPASVNNGGVTNTYIPSGTPHPGCVAIDKQMLICLNNWVTAKNSETGTHPTYASWQRPTTKVLNDDLPLPMMTDFDAVAATGSDAFVAYGQVNTLLNMYKNANQAVWLYRNKDGLASNGGSSAKLYIADHNADGNPLTVIPGGTVNAYVGVMLDNSAGADGANPTFGNGVTDCTDWHMFSSPMVAAPLGIDYTDNTQWGTQFSYEHPSGMPYYLHTGEGYFPTHRYGTSLPANNGSPSAAGNEGNYYQEWDFYTYNEPEYHWINFKRNSNSHWHQDIETDRIHYHPTSAMPEGNEENLVRGRGYLLATREETFLQCHGQLTEGEVTIPVTIEGNYSMGYNFLGNPYLTYLDFDKFVTLVAGNAVLFGSGVAGYAIIDEDPVPGETPEHAAARGGYKYYAYNSSENTYGATKYIAPHQGFMILAANAGTATFTEDMRDLDGDGLHFRGEERPAYALVNLLAYDGNGNRDITTVELGRPDKGGMPVMRDLRMATCHVYSRYDGEDWAVAFTQPGISEVPVRFEAYADGEYTLRWNTQNGEFHYLHLIDNLTGADIDCLTTDEYRFASTTMDYKSRFRLVFGYTGIEEPEGDDPAQGSFAYQSGDELVVTGEGTVELFDVTGRRMSAERIEGVQGTMSVSGLTPGVYLLRLNTATGTRVQKIVINQ